MIRAILRGLVLAAALSLLIAACEGDDEPANEPEVPIPDGVEDMIAFVETPHSSATGLHLQGGWLLTSASAVWPAREVRVVAPRDGIYLVSVSSSEPYLTGGYVLATQSDPPVD